MRPKNQMTRIALTKNGAFLDPTGKADGRGVYVCRDIQCVAKMQKARRSHLAGDNSITDDVFEKLRRAAERG